MALSRDQYRTVNDLYRTGTEVRLKDGKVLWFQAPNRIDLGKIQSMARAARARMTLGLADPGSDDTAVYEAMFETGGSDLLVDAFVQDGAADRYASAQDEIAADPAWAERMEIFRNSDHVLELPEDHPDRKQVEDLLDQHRKAVDEIVEAETGRARRKFAAMTDDELKAHARARYIDLRGTEAALEELRLAEILHGVRVCAGTETDPERVDPDTGKVLSPAVWDHKACEGHVLRLYEHRRDVEDIPDDLADLYRAAQADLAFRARDARFPGPAA